MKRMFVRVLDPIFGEGFNPACLSLYYIVCKLREFARIVFDFGQWFLVIAAVDYVRVASHSRILAAVYYFLVTLWWVTAVQYFIIPAEIIVRLTIGDLKESGRAQFVFLVVSFGISAALAYGVFFRMLNILHAFEHAQFPSL